MTRLLPTQPQRGGNLLDGERAGQGPKAGVASR
jgi:hypothetical protein